MKKPLIIISILALSASALSAQNLKLGAGVTITHFSAKNYFGKSISDDGFGISDGAAYGLAAKYELPESPFALTARFSYMPLNADDSREFKEPESDSLYYEAVQYVKIKSELYQLGVGAEYVLKKGKSFSAYAAVGVFGSYYGDFNIKTSDVDENTESTVGGFSRMGAEFGLGVNINILKSLSLDVSGKYGFYNIGSSSQTLYSYKYEDGYKDVKEDMLSGMAVNINLFWTL